MSCILCLEASSMPALKSKFIDIYSEEGLYLGISTIIHKHFCSIKLNENNSTPITERQQQQYVCRVCWNIVKDFHSLYERVAKAYQNCFQAKSLAVLAVKDDISPHELLGTKTAASRAATTETNFEYSQSTVNINAIEEIKLEVNEFESLPQIEVIEETVGCPSERSLRATRRRRQSDILNCKRIKKESSLDIDPGLAYDVFEETVSTKNIDSILSDTNATTTTIANSTTTATTSTTVTTISTTVNTTTNSTIDYIAQTVTVKKRGRPRKNAEAKCLIPNVKQRRGRRAEIEMSRLNEAEQSNRDAAADDICSIKIELEDKSQQDIGENIHHDDSGSNEDDFDTTTDTTELDNDTESSWPEGQEKETYAIIYKKVPVKPKKYRKHPKPLVPPKRMTRDEIEARHARQKEYDMVIGKFFENMRCPKCQLLVRSFGDMRAHFRISHNDDHGFVECCGRRFITRKTLAEHVYVHWNPEHFKCNTCGKACLDSKQLESHENSHLPNPPPSKYKKIFHCDKCPKTFSSKASFEHHSFAKHVPKEEFKFHCSQCNKKLPTDRKLKEHLKYSHDAQNAVICDKCGKTLKSGYSLKKHSEIEHSDKPKPKPEPRQCEICGTWLRHMAGLKQHMKSMHEDTKTEHRCHICNKVSSTSRALKRHIYHNHECAKKFKCTMCEKAFKRAQDLREHTSVHTGEVLYTCPNCPMTFFSNANMYKHRQRLHRAEWEADRKKPIPPNIMGQAKQGSKLVKLKCSGGAVTIIKSCSDERLPSLSQSTAVHKTIGNGNTDARYENLEFL